MAETIRKLIPIARLTRDPEIQCRVKIDESRVAEYADIVTEHGAMEAIVAFTPDLGDAIRATDVITVADGWHRLLAYEKAGKDKIQVNVLPGDRSDALEYAIRSMCRHGMRATNADKRRSATLAVEDPKLGQKTDKQIAQLIGVSVALVNECRRGITPAAKRAKTVGVSEHKRAAPEAKPVTARERKDATVQPTKAMILKQIESWVNEDQVDEAEVVGLSDTKEAHYRWMCRDGELTTLKVVNKNGRSMVEVPVIVKSVVPDLIVLKYEGAGKLVLEGE